MLHGRSHLMHPIVPWKLWLSGAFFCTYLAVQVAVPLRGLYGDGGGQFCWFMYSGRVRRVELVLHFEDGRATPLREEHELRRRARLLRSEVNRVRFLPPQLCAADSSLRRVTIRRLDSGEESEYFCPE
jgi:hypothetical protein